MSRRVIISLVVAIAVLLGSVVAVNYLTGEPAPPLARADRPGCVPLNISASSEKAALLTDIANDYNRDDRQVAGRCVDVRVDELASGTAAAVLAKDWDDPSRLRPDVWSPASSLWAGILQERLAAAGRPALVPDDRPSLAQTPLVIAMPKPMAEALGWPGGDIGWADLADLARDPAGWGKRGHPEWGAFKLGKTNPNISTSGMAATAATFYAATGLSTDLSPDDLARPEVRDFVSSIESSVVHYGDTTLTFLENLYDVAARGGGQALGYISAVAVEEKSVWDYNQGNPSGKPATRGQQLPPKVPLVAIYPHDGTLVSDNPYLVLTASWVDDAKRAAAADFLSYAHDEKQQGRFQDAAFRSFDGDPGEPIVAENGLSPDREITVLRPPGPAVLNQIIALWDELRKKANLLFVLDVSWSMSAQVGAAGNRLDLAKTAIGQSLDLLNGQDKVGLWAFSSRLQGDEPHRVVISPEPVASVRTDYPSLIQELQPRGGTALYKTVRDAVAQVRAQFDPTRINAVIVLTDGVNEYPADDNLPQLLADLTTDDTRLRVRVFPIAYTDDAKIDTLTQIAQVTTGRAYHANDPKTISKVLSDVVSNF